jgi:hypothetical protein
MKKWLLLTLAAPMALAKPQAAPPSPVPMTYEKGHLPRHSGNYVPLAIRWQTNDKVADVLGVYPHPIVSDEMYLATASGLMKSTDAGQTLKPLAAGAADKIGRVSNIAFAPDNARKLIIATADHGLFVTTDGGETIKPLASKSGGLIADTVRAVYYAPDDPFHRTLLAVFGEDAAGLSRSIDGGKTWQSYFPDKHMYGVYFTGGTDGKEMLFDAAPADDAAARSVYFTPSMTEPWQKLIDDVIVTGSALQTPRKSTIYLATANKGIFRIARQGGIIRNIGPADVTDWSSFGVTFGATADAPLFYAYHARKLGMVLWTPKDLAPAGDEPDEAATPEAPRPEQPPSFRTASDGLFTGPLVLEGSAIRANAGGTAFFAVINRQLYQSMPTANGPIVLDVSVTPADARIDPEAMRATDAALLAALKDFSTARRVAEASAKLKPSLDAHLKEIAERRLTVKATIKTLPTDPPTSVTVDLSRLGLSASASLYDDGQHGDDAKDDGIYANSFSPDYLNLRPPNEDWREAWPGPVRLTVSVLTKSNALAGGVGSMTLFRRRESIPFADDVSPAKKAGNVVGSIAHTRDYKSRLKVISIRGAGDWAASIGHWRDTVDISSQAALVFTIKASAPTDSEITLSLRDAPTYTRPADTPPVKLKAEGFLKDGKITTTEQRVVVPVCRLVKDAGDFQAAVTSALTLSGNVEKPVDLLIREIKFVPTLDDEAEDGP